MNFFEFKEWYEAIEDNDFEYIKSLKYYGFRIVFNKNSTYWKNLEIYPQYPWNSNFTKIYFKKKTNIEKWLYLKNKNLYLQWLKINKIKQTK